MMLIFVIMMIKIFITKKNRGIKMDIKIKKNSHLFKVRTSGIIMKDNKILVEQYRDTSYFTLPGGYVEIGEDSSSAIIREIKEEVGVNFKIDRYLGIVENFFINANQEKHME